MKRSFNLKVWMIFWVIGVVAIIIPNIFWLHSAALLAMLIGWYSIGYFVSYRWDDWSLTYRARRARLLAASNNNNQEVQNDDSRSQGQQQAHSSVERSSRRADRRVRAGSQGQLQDRGNVEQAGVGSAIIGWKIAEFHRNPRKGTGVYEFYILDQEDRYIRYDGKSQEAPPTDDYYRTILGHSVDVRLPLEFLARRAAKRKAYNFYRAYAPNQGSTFNL